MDKQFAEAVVTTAEVSEHPAVRAWTSLSGRTQGVERVKRLSGKRKSHVYRLAGESLPNGSIIAKLSRDADAAIERTVYEDVLGRIALPAVLYYGSCEERATGHTWLFIEDVRGPKFAPLEESHRALAGGWLGTLHSLTAGLQRPDLLPGRSADDYRELLRSVKGSIEANLGNPNLTAAYLGPLQDFLCQLDLVLVEWHRIAAICHEFPPALVHGDLASKNVRIRETAGGQFLLPFDWEGAGWGVPAADLAQMSDRKLGASVSPDLEAYERSAGGPRGSVEAIPELATVGVIFRILHMVDWLAWTLPTDKIGKTVGAIRGYSVELTRAARRLKLPDGATKYDAALRSSKGL
jgi:Ser/Thr protein kinase RdoA (MazF antagonist)